MNNTAELYVGLMSGTSLDGIDAVLCSFADNTPNILACHTTPLPEDLRAPIVQLAHTGPDEIEHLAAVDRGIAELSARAVQAVLAHKRIPASAVKAIGSHGQTVRHLPAKGYTLQVGDPNLIAELTHITVVADFRRRDMAAGGQGAPLAPAFHQAVFAHPTENRVIVNVGGMSNVSVLPADPTQPVIGFDTGPGNALMDYWCQQYLDQPYDETGAWSASASPDQQLLAAMLTDSFFQAPPPKSTGREQFNPQWLGQWLAAHPITLPPDTVQATLCHLTAHTIATAIQHYANKTEAVFVCGGGAKNTTLLSTLQTLLPTLPVASTEALGIAPDWVEAAAFAWLAKQTLSQLPGNLATVTGASGLRVLGGIYPGT